MQANELKMINYSTIQIEMLAYIYDDDSIEHLEL